MMTQSVYRTIPCLILATVAACSQASITTWSNTVSDTDIHYYYDAIANTSGNPYYFNPSAAFGTLSNPGTTSNPLAGTTYTDSVASATLIANTPNVLEVGGQLAMNGSASSVDTNSFYQASGTQTDYLTFTLSSPGSISVVFSSATSGSGNSSQSSLFYVDGNAYFSSATASLSAGSHFFYAYNHTLSSAGSYLYQGQVVSYGVYGDAHASNTYDARITSVPEPASMALLFAGGSALLRRRRRASSKRSRA